MIRPAAGEDAQFDLVTFLVSSARGALEEGVFTASLRLITAAGRLANIVSDQSDETFFRELAERIDRNASKEYLSSADDYAAFLDESLAAVAKEVVRRNAPH